MADIDDQDFIAEDGLAEALTQPIAPLSPLRASNGPRPYERPQELPAGQEEDTEKEQGKKERKKVNRVMLNEERLMGRNGIVQLPIVMKNVKFKGKGQEKEDLSLLLGKLEHWAHVLMPRQQFSDVVDKIESLGTKKAIKRHAYGVKKGTILFNNEGVIEDTSETVVQGQGDLTETVGGSQMVSATGIPENVSGVNDEINNLLENDFPDLNLP
ncbi:TIMELESS-interacting protein-like [Rhopilema esculentum]|uniref:TIMELESS-interacting protein-like n=1 Tax=Rhopilema esculentum TaxID=499914 RepID=UPI0031DFC31B|eukprot:gene5017-124_t